MTEALDMARMQQIIDHARQITGFDSDHEPTEEELDKALGSMFAVAMLLVREVERLREENADLRERPCDHYWLGTEEGIVCKYCGEAA
jgi:hypothetical protein